MCYETEGNYEVSLTVKNGVGEDSYTWTQYVQVVKGDKLPFSENFELGVLLNHESCQDLQSSIR